ncbi:MAG: hypothetical protein HY275_04830 [Gemmatimonadetes bacterium]|nr:hypothetical protein [Gemmatimonadota bacterium]
MKKPMLTLVLAIAPAVLHAQVSGQAQASAQGSASVQSKKGATSANTSASASAEGSVDAQPPAEWSAESREKLTAMYADAKARGLPVRPMARRVAEGRAKGAAETTIIAAAGKVAVNLRATQEAMVAAGREHPRDAELEAGARAMERGMTSVQITELARRAPSERSLAVALDVVAKLVARGSVTSDAVAAVESRLVARASDEAIGSLAASGDATAGGALGAGRGGASASGAATGTVRGATNAAGNTVTGSAAGSATGAVAGAVKKP